MNKGGVFLIGGIIGFAAGIFLAPKDGESNRADAADWARELLGQGQERYQQGAQRIQSSISSVRPSADAKNDQLQAKIDAARKIIAEQVAKNAAAAKAAIEEDAQIVAEAIEETAPAAEAPEAPAEA